MLQGKELSYTNLLDLDAAARIVLEFTSRRRSSSSTRIRAARRRAAPPTPTCAHASRCAGCIRRHRRLNRPIDVDAAHGDRVDVHRSGDRAVVDDDARAILATKANMRVVVLDRRAGQRRLPPRLEMRSIVGGVLVQTRDVVLEARAWTGPSAGIEGRDQAAADRRRSGRPCGSPGASARM